jgi:hypothetical protein
LAVFELRTIGGWRAWECVIRWKPSAWLPQRPWGLAGLDQISVIKP